MALFDHQQRIGELTPERRFYEARRQQMMEPSIRWNGIHDWYAVMGRKLERIVTLFACMYKAVCAGSGGGLLMIAGALLSGWRGRSAMYKGLLTLLLLFTCFARAQVVDTAIRQSATTATGVKYCQPVTLSAVPESKLTGIQRAGGSQYAPSGLQHGGGGEK